ncbi:unnamed protein product [Clonostachys rosea]|uniref:Uncharacterized protein n=1 Tax=Bionectria ochroleuca TaxID=29856 RepID=A0ABY6U333_BIOOC|nr:unnamed protein product [Clonostachys rosea]
MSRASLSFLSPGLLSGWKIKCTLQLLGDDLALGVWGTAKLKSKEYAVDAQRQRIQEPGHSPSRPVRPLLQSTPRPSTSSRPPTLADYTHTKKGTARRALLQNAASTGGKSLSVPRVSSQAAQPTTPFQQVQLFAT